MVGSQVSLLSTCQVLPREKYIVSHYLWTWSCNLIVVMDVTVAMGVTKARLLSDLRCPACLQVLSSSSESQIPE